MYPTLTEMGVANPNQISSYEYFQTAMDEDMLRIRYKRQSGSLLPDTRTYRFRRIGVAIAGSNQGTGAEISPKLSAAITELDKLLSARGAAVSLAAQIAEALDAAETELSRVRDLVAKLKDTTGA